MEDDHNVEQISKTSHQQSNASTSDAVHKENFDVGEELEDNNPNEDQRRMPRVQTHEQHRRLGITVPSQHTSRINESTSDAVRPIVFGNIDYEEEDANFDIIGHKEAATKLGVVSKEAAAFGICGEEDDNPNEDLYENQRGTPRVQTREQRRRLGKTVPSQHASRISESTSDAVCPPACGNIDHEEEDANFGITSHEEAATKFGIVPKEAVAFGIGGEEDDYQNEEKHQRVMTHEQRRKSAHKATFDIGEELEDDNPDEDWRRMPRVQTHEQRRRLGKTIPSQHASRINESTFDAVHMAVSRNIDQEEEDVNLGIIGHEEAATKFGIVPKETPDFGIGEEEEEYQNEERRQRVLTHEQRRKSIRKAAFDIGEELEDDNPDEDQRRTPKFQTHEQRRRLGKTVPSQHASQIRESTKDAVRLTAFGNIDHEEEYANFDIIGHEEAATKFGVVPKEAAAFDIGEELEDDNPDEDRRRTPKVQTHEQRRRLGKTIPSQHASRIKESTSDAVRLTVSGNIDQEEEDVNLGIIGHEEAATKFGIVPEEAADFGIGEEEEEYQNEERRQRVLTHEQRRKSIRKAGFDIGEELEDDNLDEDQRRTSRVQTHEQRRRLGKTVPSQPASQIKESTKDAVRSTAFENIDHEEEDVNFDIIGHEEAATKFGVVPKEAAAFGIGGEEDDNPNEDFYEDQRRMPRVQTREQRERLGKTIPSQHASRINESTSDAVCPPASGNIDHEEEDANFGITGHEEAATKFGIVPKEAAPFGIGGEEDDYQNEEKRQRVLTHEQYRKSAYKATLDIGEELKDDNLDEDHRHMPRVQTHEQRRSFEKTVPSQHASRINESTSDAVRSTTFENIDHEEEDANFDIIGHEEAATKFGVVPKEAVAFGIGGEEDDNPNEDLYEDQRRMPRVQTREQRKRLGKTIPSQHVSRINESTSDAVCPPASGNIDHEEEDANFGITGHEEAATKFGIVPNEATPFGIGGEEDDNQNEERRQRVLTHEQYRKSAYKATFDIGEELEDDNQDEDQRPTPRVQTHEQRRRFGKTVPSQHASRINESTSDADFLAASGNIDQEEEDANFGISGREEAATKFGVVPKEAAAFGIGGEEDDNPNEDLYEDQRRMPRVQTREQRKRLGKTIPSQHASRINKSTSDAVCPPASGNIDHEEEDANFGITGHEEAATKFGIVPNEATPFGIGGEEDDNQNEERRQRVLTHEQYRKSAYKATFDIGEELEDDNQDEDQRPTPRVQTHEQRRRFGKTVPSQHASRINESTSDVDFLAASGNIDQEEEDANFGISGREEAATKFGIVPKEAAAFGIGGEEDDNPNEDLYEDQRRMPRVQTREQRKRLGKTIPSQHASRINESTSDAVCPPASRNIDHEEEDANLGITGHEEAATKFGIVPNEATPFGIGGEEDDNQNEERRQRVLTHEQYRKSAYKATFDIGEELEDDNQDEDQRPTPRVQTHEQRRRFGKTVPSQHASRINESTSDADFLAASGNIDQEEEDANFGISGREEAATKFGIVPKEAAAFGIGEKENDYQNEERSQRVLTHDQRRKSGTIVAPECVIQINDNERQKPVIISGSGWSTLKVPTPMFEVDKGAYVPKIVSIGPFHYNEPSLRAMQTQKRRFLNRLIQNQTGQPILEENLKNAMRELEGKTRDFYAEDFQAIKPDDFVQMMLLDGCFIVEMMRLYEKKYVGEPIFETRWTLLNISRDLLLLENQLPMFVLQKIFELTGEASPDLNMLALEFFEPLRLGKDEFATLKLNKYADEYIHLLALFHSTLTSDDKLYPKQLAKSEKSKTHLNLPGKGWVHNAKTLRYAGIELKNNSGSILHIQLKGKTLNIPTMIIDDSIGPLLRNLIAYEQNNRSVAPYFCCLAVFLDSIVDTVEDVKILRDAGIIKQAKGGDKEVTNLFSSLTKELVFDIDKEDCYLIKQIENINRLCRAHDTRVQICRLLAKLNYKGLLKTYASILVTVIFSLIVAKFASYKTSVNQYYPPLSPPK